MRHSLTPRLGALGLACLVLVSFPPAGVFAQDAPSPHAPFDFAIKRQFLEDLWGQRTFLPTYQISMDHRSRIKSVAQDCEVHIAGTLIGETFGKPRFMLVKPPNLCKFLPGATEPSSSSTRATWRAIRAFRPRVAQIQYNAVY